LIFFFPKEDTPALTDKMKQSAVRAGLVDTVILAHREKQGTTALLWVEGQLLLTPWKLRETQRQKVVWCGPNCSLLICTAEKTCWKEKLC